MKRRKSKESKGIKATSSSGREELSSRTLFPGELVATAREHIRQKRYEEAESLLVRTINLFGKVLGVEPIDFAQFDNVMEGLDGWKDSHSQEMIEFRNFELPQRTADGQSVVLERVSVTEETIALMRLVTKLEDYPNELDAWEAARFFRETISPKEVLDTPGFIPCGFNHTTWMALWEAADAYHELLEFTKRDASPLGDALYTFSHDLFCNEYLGGDK